MKYSKKEIGQELKRGLENGYGLIHISRWAYDLFVNIETKNHSPEVDHILQHIFSMEIENEVEHAKADLIALADELIKEE
jgi:hypothetical protein